MDANNIKNTVDLNTIKKLVSNEIHENNFQKNIKINTMEQLYDIDLKGNLADCLKNYENGVNIISKQDQQLIDKLKGIQQLQKYLQEQKKFYLVIDNEKYNILGEINAKFLNNILRKMLNSNDMDVIIHTTEKALNCYIIENDYVIVKKIASNKNYDYFIRSDGTFLARDKKTENRKHILTRFDNINKRLYVIFNNNKVYCDVLMIKYFTNLNESIEDVTNNYIIGYIDKNPKNLDISNLVVYPSEIRNAIKNTITDFSKSKTKAVELLDKRNVEVVKTFSSVTMCLEELSISKKQFYNCIKGFGKYRLRYKN